MTQRGKFKISTVVRLTGVSELVLRAWERRYGILKPERGHGGQRLYSAEDVAVLRAVQDELKRGRSIGEVASQGREALLAAAQAQPHTEVPDLALRVVEAAAHLDRARLERCLDQAFASMSAEPVMEHVILPALREIGERWAAGTLGIAGEHLATAAIVHRARKLLEVAEPRGANPVIVTCFPDERHELGPILLAWRIARTGTPVSWLGGAMPFEDLEQACEALSPRAVCLSVTRPAVYEMHRPELLGLLKRRAGRTACHIGGQGAPPEDAEVTSAGGKLWPAGQSPEFTPRPL